MISLPSLNLHRILKSRVWSLFIYPASICLVSPILVVLASWTSVATHIFSDFPDSGSSFSHLFLCLTVPQTIPTENTFFPFLGLSHSAVDDPSQAHFFSFVISVLQCYKRPHSRTLFLVCHFCLTVPQTRAIENTLSLLSFLRYSTINNPNPVVRTMSLPNDMQHSTYKCFGFLLSSQIRPFFIYPTSAVLVPPTLVVVRLVLRLQLIFVCKFSHKICRESDLEGAPMTPPCSL